MFCFTLLLRREQRKRDMPFGRVLSTGELPRSADAFPFLPSLQKRENESDSVVSVSLANPPAGISGGTSGWWEEGLILFSQKDPEALERVRN
jgi:hypothetical protein